MSYKVLVIPEDPTWNGYILRPLTQALLKDAGKPNAKVKLLENPRVGGFEQAVRAIRNELQNRYGFFDLWLFFPDADRATPNAMANLEADLQSRGVPLFCCPAKPEVEIYACVAFQATLPGTWKDVRKHPQMKEVVFEPLRMNLRDRRPGGGREQMIRKSLQNLQRLFQLCPETKLLRDRIAAYL